MKQTPELTLNVETVRVLDQSQKGAPRDGNMLTASSCFPRCTCHPGLER